MELVSTKKIENFTTGIQKSRSNLSKLLRKNTKLNVPHTSRPCNPPYGIKLKEIFADSWSHWSICQSRSHIRMTQVDRIELKPGNPRYFQEIQMQGDLCDVFIGTSTNDRQKSSRARAMSRPSTEPKPGNRPFSSISPKITKNHHPDRLYGTGSDKPTNKPQKSLADISCKAPPRRCA